MLAAQRTILLRGAPSWVLRAPDGTIPDVDIPYPLQKAWVKGVGVVPLSSLHSISRAANESYTNLAGVISSVGSNALAVGDAGLQVWEARTNLVLQSASFSNAAWTNTSAILTANTTIAPDGTNNGWHLAASTNATEPSIGSAYTVINGACTKTVIAKAAEVNFLLITFGSAPASAGVWFNLSTGIVGTKQANVTSASIVALTNGWYACSATATTGTTSGQISIRAELADNSTSWTSGLSGQGIYLFSAQDELGAFASPYIPTTTGTVTRAADNITAAGALLSGLKAASGTLLAIGKGTQSTGSTFLVGGDNIGSDIPVRPGGGGANKFSTTSDNGTVLTAVYGSGDKTGASKLAICWDGTGRSAAANNGTVVSDANTYAPLTAYAIGNFGNLSSFYDGNLSRLWVSRARLSDAALEAFTQ